MRVRGTQTNPNYRRPIASSVINFATSAVIACVGFFMSLPFVYKFMVVGMNVHYFSFLTILMIVGLVIGGPLLVFGMIGLIANRSRIGQLTESDVARIRHSVESTSYNNK